MADDDGKRTPEPIGGAYAHTQLQRAIETALTHGDPSTRARAGERALAWEAVLSGMATGAVTVGSRTPVRDVPAWATPEVVHGGFATGRLVAGGAVEGWEHTLLETTPFAGAADVRAVLNRWFLSDDGLAHLGASLADGSYHVDVPEASALPTVAWCLANGQEADALDLMTAVHPFLDRLRFYPRPAVPVAIDAAAVHLRTVDEVVGDLRAVRAPDAVLTMIETITVWQPLGDRLVALWLETVADDWPCRTWPDDWAERRAQWLADHEAAARVHTRGTRHRHPKSNVAILAGALTRCPLDSRDLTARDVGRIRRVLLDVVAAHGRPGSAEHARVRAQQVTDALRPTRAGIARALVDRLADLPSHVGLAELERVVAPVDATAVPASLVRRVARARSAPVDELVATGAIPSAEVLASVLPQLSAHVTSAGFLDVALRRLHTEAYAAFRARRSLLLVDLQHQVRFDELPWVPIIRRHRSGDDTSDARTLATQALRLTLCSFPHTILPNVLVRELAVLSDQAGVAMPWVEELAADIFAGRFTPKWRQAASITANVLQGTLYARYYDLLDIDALDVLEPAPAPSRSPALRRRDAPTTDRFAGLCERRAREAGRGEHSYVPRNGAIIEQAQILTSHNLAPAMAAFGLREELSAVAPHLVTSTFWWILNQQNRADLWPRDRRTMLKNTAYAWRQLVFFLSLLEPDQQEPAVARLRAMAHDTRRAWQVRLEPVLAGLEAVMAGARFDGDGRVGTGRRFLGWSVGSHWLDPSAM